MLNQNKSRISTPLSSRFLMMVQLDLITFYVLLIGGSQHIEAQSDKWTDICELDSGDGGMYVSGDVKKIFDDPSDKNNKVVVVENKISDVFVKCVNNKGNAKIYDDNDNVLLENHPEKSSAKLLLWKKNFTTFWNSEKSLKCR